MHRLAIQQTVPGRQTPINRHYPPESSSYTLIKLLIRIIRRIIISISIIRIRTFPSALRNDLSREGFSPQPLPPNKHLQPTVTSRPLHRISTEKNSPSSKYTLKSRGKKGYKLCYCGCLTIPHGEVPSTASRTAEATPYSQANDRGSNYPISNMNSPAT